MKQPQYILKNGTHIKTHAVLESADGMCVANSYINNRRPNTEGFIRGVVPGHGGDVYVVEHSEDKLAVYCFTDFELVEEKKTANVEDVLMEMARLGTVSIAASYGMVFVSVVEHNRTHMGSGTSLLSSLEGVRQSIALINDPFAVLTSELDAMDKSISSDTRVCTNEYAEGARDVIDRMRRAVEESKK